MTKKSYSNNLLPADALLVRWYVLVVFVLASQSSIRGITFIQVRASSSNDFKKDSLF
jgi:hypothetical protein